VNNLHRSECVGPILQAGRIADAVVAAIRELNAEVEILDRGSYLRVMVPHRCRVTRRLIERHTTSPFRLPRDLELVMSSFKGRFVVSEEEASWES